MGAVQSRRDARLQERRGKRTGTHTQSPVVIPMEAKTGLNVGGEVERVPLELSKGDGRMLQVVEKHLHLDKQTQ